MANKIKGITIEIGGDTTKLDKALSGTNKQITTTQKELKAVEKALKMDPGNTELLAQKQRLLADSASATSKKLHTLQEAAKSADSALARGQDYQAKYEPLRQQIDTVSASLKGLMDNQQQMEAGLASGTISAKSYEAFQAKIQDTTQKLDELKAAQQAVEQEFSGAKLNQSQYDALQRELVETEQAAEDAEKALKNFDTAGEKLSAGAGKIADGASKVKNATSGLSTAAGGVLTAAVATVPVTEELRNALATLETNAQRAGVGLGSAQTALRDFTVVSDELDSSLEATSNLLQAGFTESNLQKAVENLSGAYLQFPDTMKIESLADSLQETLATGEATGQFGELLDRLGIGAADFSVQLEKITTEADRQNFALDTLAHAGLSDTYNAWLQNNQAIVDSRQASYDFQQSMAELAATIQPFLTEFVELGTGILDFFNSLPSGVQASIGVILLLIAAISPLAGLISSISTVVGMAGLSMSSWLPIILAVTAALVALASIIALVTGRQKELDTSMAGTSTDRGGGFSRAVPTLGTEALPHLASGGVVRRNSPTLAVIGDNPQESEIVAPESTIKNWTIEGIRESGLLRSGGGTQRSVMTLDGRTFARLETPYILEELSRLGIKVTRN